jgi:hypothetical protein
MASCLSSQGGPPRSGGTPPHGEGPDAAGRGSDSLEVVENTVTEGEAGSRRFEVSACRCDCWFCAPCALGKGLKLREELFPILRSFKGLLMVTFTVDPELFESPKAAYLYMRERRCLSRTVQDLWRWGCLHSRRYFYVIEWQKVTEQVHFHVLFDASFIPHDTLLASWGKHRPANAGPVRGTRPRFGTVWVSKGRFGGGALHATRYATKYLTKSPAHGFPAWVMSLGKDVQIRRYGTSRGFWGPSDRVHSESSEAEHEPHATYAERIQECGRTVKVCELHERIDGRTGEVIVERVWLGELGVRYEILRQINDGLPPGRRRRVVEAGSVDDVVERLSDLACFEVEWLQRARCAFGEAA